MHKQCDPRRIVRWGYYFRRCVEKREQRFRCRECTKTFSLQTYRHDYRDRRPDANERLFELLTSGVGLRQAARLLRIGATTAQKKMRKLARTCELLHQNLAKQLPPGRTYVMDEEESYETASIRPVTVPMIIDSEHWFVVATAVGPIRRRAPEGSARRHRQDLDELRRGRRRDESRKRIGEVLRMLRHRTNGCITLVTDLKSSYATVAHQVFGRDLVHIGVAGSAPRTPFNPLFPINTTIAMSRDNCGRLRRHSWLVSKLAKWLSGQLAIFTAYRNYVRRRFNRDSASETPARLLGLLPRNLQPGEVVRWRQDWGERSLNPMSISGAHTVAEQLVSGDGAD